MGNRSRIHQSLEGVLNVDLVGYAHLNEVLKPSLFEPKCFRDPLVLLAGHPVCAQRLIFNSGASIGRFSGAAGSCWPMVLSSGLRNYFHTASSLFEYRI